MMHPRHMPPTYHCHPCFCLAVTPNRVPSPPQELNQALQQFVRQHYPQGLKWNPSGGSIAEAQKKAAAGGTSSSSSATASAAAAPRGPPVPPPAPSAEMLLRERPGAVAERTSNSGGGLKDVFSELQKVRCWFGPTHALKIPGWRMSSFHVGCFQ